MTHIVLLICMTGYEEGLRLAGHTAVYHQAGGVIYMYGGYTHQNSRYTYVIYYRPGINTLRTNV